ncbi:hypothetical protein TNCV_4834171 [Trichonephila clavipes]|nr:hypothetical protein TNCV_4834171 [Trichonephila clavipes]
MDSLILSHSQETRTTLDLARPSSNFHTIPTGSHLGLHMFNVHCPSSARRGFSGTRLEFMTRHAQIHYLDHQATMVT